MNRIQPKRLRTSILVAALIALAVTTATALGGSGVGAVFNLGQTNSVNATSTLSGTSSSAQLRVKNASTASLATGIYGQSGSATAAGVWGTNLAGGPGLQATVSGNGVAPLKVNSNHVVPNLHAANSDALGGHGSSFFLPTTGTAADSSKLGGLPAKTFYQSRTTPLGNGRATIDSAGDVGYYTSTTIGPDGLGLISYYDDTNKLVKVAHCSNVACSSAVTTPLDSVGGPGIGFYTSITVGSDGLGLIAYRDATNADLKVAHCSNITCSSATKVTVDSAGDVGAYASIAVGSDGLPVVSYQDATNADLKVAHCSNLSCSTSTQTIITTPAVDGQYTSVTVGADGLPLISFFDETNADLKLVHCANVTCSTWTLPIATVDSTGAVGYYTSATVGTDGLGLVSYFDDTNKSLKVAHCSDVNCATTTTGVVVDNVGLNGYYTSITIGPDGLGLVSYFSDAAKDLNVAHCMNTGCSSVTKTVVDSVGNTGYYTSLTIGADGLPLVSYFDDTAKDLRVAHCSSPFCASYFRRR